LMVITYQGGSSDGGKKKNRGGLHVSVLTK
jgi:hypothetical protein